MRYWAKRHYRHRLVTVCLSMAIGGAVGWRYYRQPHPPVIQPTQAAYVWQRHWDPGLQEALQRQGPAFQRLIVLAAEVNGADHHPQIADTDRLSDAQEFAGAHRFGDSGQHAGG